jgi:TRAP-type C4-dicarboxylate transport system substrate-binding protein
MVPDIVLISTITWNRLSPEIQQMIQEAADESVEFQKQLWKQDSDEALKKVQEHGVTIYNPEKGPFREKVKQMLASYDGTEVGELIKQIDQIQ